MSRENVEIVVGLIKAWMSGNRRAARAAWDPDAVMIIPVIDSNVLVGLPKIERAIESWRKSWGTWRFEVEEVIDADESVIVIGRQRAEGKESGAEVDLLSCGVWSLRNSKVIRAEFFGSKAEALKAAGLQK
jgi:ketosteroid isomerase-like protein